MDSQRCLKRIDLDRTEERLCFIPDRIARIMGPQKSIDGV
jgi:hypothetical protein